MAAQKHLILGHSIRTYQPQRIKRLLGAGGQGFWASHPEEEEQSSEFFGATNRSGLDCLRAFGKAVLVVVLACGVTDYRPPSSL